MSLKRIILGWGVFEWIVVVLVVSFAVGTISDGIDWLDRRACRTGGGTVQSLEDHGEWRCAGGAVPK